MVKLILIITFFAGFFFGGLFLVHPVYEEYETKIEINEALQKELENIEKYVEDLEKIKEKVEENKEEIEIVQSAFPEDHDAPALFWYLDSTINKHNLTATGEFGSFSVEDYTPADSDREHVRINKIPFSLSLVGEYENIKMFSQEIETLARVIKINNISLSGSSKDGFDSFDGLGVDDDISTEGKIGVKIEANTYSY